MRPLFALIFGVAVFVTIGFYLDFSNSIKPPPLNFDEEEAPGVYSLELITTFDAEAGSFDLEPLAIEVTFRGEIVLFRADPVSAGTLLRVNDIENIKAGRNEFNVKINPKMTSETKNNRSSDPFSFSLAESKPTSSSESETQVSKPRAARLRILRDTQVIGESILWADGPDAIEGTLTIDIQSTEPPAVIPN